MRLYVALSLLEEREWSNGTGACCSDPLELFLRKCLRGESTVGNNLFGGHVSLYFEDADASMVDRNRPFAQRDAVNATNFSVDILDGSRHSVNLVQSGACGWYGRWSYGVVQLYEVIGATKSQIRQIHAEAIGLLHHRYSSMHSVVALLPWAPWSFCTSYCCCCCSYCCGCFTDSSINCTGAVEVALRRGLRRPLDIPTRFVEGGRLPAELVQQLEQSGVVQYQRDILLVNTQNDRERDCVTGAVVVAAVPLLPR